MNFTTAISSLRHGQAARRPQWHGYIECLADLTTYFSINTPAGSTPTDEETTAANAALAAGWRIIKFHYADGETVVPYLFDSDPTNDLVKSGSAVKIGTTTKTMFTDYVPITTFLFSAILQTDWVVENTADIVASQSTDNEF